MATLDYTGDAAAGAGQPNGFIQMGKPVTFYRELDVPTIIASDTTMTSNGYITADDIIQAIHVPAGFWFEHAHIRIVTACTADVNVEVGLAGGAEMISSFDADGSAGTMAHTDESDSYDMGHMFTANDTVDVQFITANAVVGKLELFVTGTMYQLQSTS